MATPDNAGGQAAPRHDERLPLFVVDCFDHGFSARDFPRQESASLCAPATDSQQKVQAALDNQAVLEDKNAIIVRSIEDGTLDTDTLKQLVAENQKALATNRKFLDSCILAFPPALTPTAKSAVKAAKVLATAELLESILLNLSARDVLKAAQISRASSQIFKESPKVQDKLSLRPRRDGTFHDAFYRADAAPASFFNLLDVDIDQGTFTDKPGCAFNELPVSIAFDHRFKLPNIGSLARRMLVCNPPAHSMVVSLNCCPAPASVIGNSVWGQLPAPGDGGSDGGWGISQQLASSRSPSEAAESMCQAGEQAPATEELSEEKKAERAAKEDDEINVKVCDTLMIQSTTGITIRDIYDATQRLYEKHSQCPHAKLHMHRSDGTVKVKVTFATTLTLRRDDPYLLEKDRRQVMCDLQNRPWYPPEERRSVLGLYVDFKDRATKRGWAIPTFEELAT